MSKFFRQPESLQTIVATGMNCNDRWPKGPTHTFPSANPTPVPMTVINRVAAPTVTISIRIC